MPFGVPVVPEVYMMTATSAACRRQQLSQMRVQRTDGFGTRGELAHLGRRCRNRLCVACLCELVHARHLRVAAARALCSAAATGQGGSEAPETANPLGQLACQHLEPGARCLRLCDQLLLDGANLRPDTTRFMSTGARDRC